MLPSLAPGLLSVGTDVLGSHTQWHQQQRREKGLSFFWAAMEDLRWADKVRSVLLAYVLSQLQTPLMFSFPFHR